MTNTLVLLSMKLQLLPFQTKHGVQVMPCMKAAASVPPLMERGQNLLETSGNKQQHTVTLPGPASTYAPGNQACILRLTSLKNVLKHTSPNLQGDLGLPGQTPK